MLVFSEKNKVEKKGRSALFMVSPLPLTLRQKRVLLGVCVMSAKIILPLTTRSFPFGGDYGNLFL